VQLQRSVCGGDAAFCQVTLETCYLFCRNIESCGHVLISFRRHSTADESQKSTEKGYELTSLINVNPVAIRRHYRLRFVLIYMNCSDVTPRCMKSCLYHVVFIRTCNVFLTFLMFVLIIVLRALSISSVYMYVCYVCLSPAR